MKRLLVFGLGYTASRLARRLRGDGWIVDATGRNGNLDFADEAAVRPALKQATHILSSVPPAQGCDPVIGRYGNDLADTLADKWLGYFSSTGIYGDTGGAWADETAQTGAGRRKDRAACDAAWLERGAFVFRLPGIYGPARSALDRVRSGTAHRIAMSGQVFSRIHVDDIVAGVSAAICGDPPPGAYNIADDLPSSHNAVIEEACRLLQCEPPGLQALEDSALSSAARGFYAENRRVANGKAKRVLGWTPRYPSYREGLCALMAQA